MVYLADDLRFDAGHMLGLPTAAEARFWLFDEAHFPRPAAADADAWYCAAWSRFAEPARECLALPQLAEWEGWQTGAGMLLAEGLARLP